MEIELYTDGGESKANAEPSVVKIIIDGVENFITIPVGEENKIKWRYRMPEPILKYSIVLLSLSSGNSYVHVGDYIR